MLNVLYYIALRRQKVVSRKKVINKYLNKEAYSIIASNIKQINQLLSLLKSSEIGWFSDDYRWNIINLLKFT